MRNYCERTPKKLYFTLIEIADMLGESYSCIDWWVKCFGIEIKYRRKFKMFSRKMVARLHVIRQMIRGQAFSHRKVRRTLRFMIKYNLA